MKTAPGHPATRRLRTPAGIVMLYALFAAIWIAGSDRVLSLLLDDPAQFERIGTYKGFLFIAVTGGLLYLLLTNWHRSLSNAIVTSTHLQQRLERVLRGANDGWWDWDLREGRIYCSPRWWEMLGYVPDELPAEPGLWRRLLHPDDREQVERFFVEAPTQAAQGISIELRLRHKDGHYVPILARYWIQRDAGGKAVQVSGTNMDLTERKQAEEALRKAHEELERRVLERTSELQQSNRQLASEVEERTRAEAVLAQRSQELARSNAELEQMAYVASHDLQEPLRMVASYLQLLEQRYGGRLDPDAHDFIEFAVDGAKRMETLIDDLLAYSRVGSRANPLQPTDCTAVVATALRSLRMAIEESGAQVQCGPLPVVMGDAVQLTQLFQNLLANAIKFRGQQAPRIAVEAEPDDGFWRFAVQDNGIGIAPEYFERIFVMFQRLHSRSTYPGTGMGLAICKKIVERHGGRIWVEAAPQQGAVFKFTLPRATGAGHEKRAGPASDRDLAGGRRSGRCAPYPGSAEKCEGREHARTRCMWWKTGRRRWIFCIGAARTARRRART